MVGTSQSGSGSSAFSTLGSSKNAQFSVMPEQLISQIKNQGDTEFVVIQRSRQSDEPKIWSSGDQQQTQHLLQQVYSTFSRQPETT